jgi:heme/copper-type cytochrome/quinol oxidase subunit 2
MWKQSLSEAKEEDNDDRSTSINMQQDNESEEAKGIWILCFLLFFCLGFVLWCVFFFLTFSSSFKKKLSPRI